MRAALANAALALAVVALSDTCFAGDRAPELRPWDAPRVDPAVLHTPPLPPEYLTEDQGFIHFAYHPSARERVRPLLAEADEIRNELTRLLGKSVLASVEVRVAAAPGEMARLAPAELPGYTSAVAFGELHLVVMSVASPLSLEPPDLPTVFRHALAHLALDEALAGQAVPRWFHEGFAVETAGDSSAQRTQTLSMASLGRRTIGLAELEARFPADAPQASLAYAESADFVRFLLAGPHRAGFAGLVERVRGGERFEPALAAAYDTDLDRLEGAWRKEMAKRYGFLPVLLAGSALWIVVAAVALVRHLRRRRALRPTFGRRHRRGDARRGAALLDGPVRVVALRDLRAARERDRLVESMPPEPEVPKVEHGGRWHTLH